MQKSYMHAYIHRLLTFTVQTCAVVHITLTDDKLKLETFLCHTVLMY